MASGDEGPIELQLPDGGHVVMSFEDDRARQGDEGVELVGALVRADGSERDIERAIRERAEGLGLRCETSSEHPTAILIRRGPGVRGG